jgi:hypothetical protein
MVGTALTSTVSTRARLAVMTVLLVNKMTLQQMSTGQQSPSSGLLMMVAAEDGLQGNHCFEPAVGTVDNPAGCHDQQCLDAVCLVENSCCEGNYTDGCVAIAREVGPDSCVPISTNNTCFEVSPVGGCTEPECERIVCQLIETCCNSGITTGEYSEECATIAEDLCS